MMNSVKDFRGKIEPPVEKGVLKIERYAQKLTQGYSAYGGSYLWAPESSQMMVFLMRGGNRSTRGKTSQSRVENQQTQSTYDAECGNRTRATLVEGKCSHHYANPAT